MAQVFISHSEQDEDLIKLISKSLDAVEVDHYVEAYEDNYGRGVVESICEEIDDCSYFLVVLTEASTRSQWVNQEIGFAYALKKTIIPVRVGKVSVRGMIQNIKGIRSESADEEEIVSTIQDYFVHELEVESFVVICEKCGEESIWELPGNVDHYNWRHKKKPMACDCDECDHMMRINPLTLLLVEDNG